MKLAAILILEVFNPLFAISIALFVSVGYIFSLLTPMTIDLWQALLIPCTLIPFAWLLSGAVKRSKQSQSDAYQFSWRVFLPLVVPAMVLAPGLYAIVSSPTVQILSHPDLHFGYINQLLYSSTPLENVFVAGYPANYYWLFHAFLAAVVKTTALRAPVVASIVNVLSVVSSFLWIGQILVLLKLGKLRTLSLGLLVVFVFCSVNITGILSLFTHVINGTYEPNNLRLLVLEGGHKHLHSSLNKLANVNSMDLGVSLFAATLYSCVRILKGKIDLRALVLISACGILGLAAVQLATFYIVVSLLGGLTLLAAWYLLRTSQKRSAVRRFWYQLTNQISPLSVVLYLGISLVLSIPLLKYNYDIAYNTRGQNGFELLNQTNLAMLWAAFALLLPLYILQWFFVIRRGNQLTYFIQISGLLGLLLGSGLSITIDNQYKGFYFLAIVLCISALFALKNLITFEKPTWRNAGRLIAILLFALVFLRIIYIDYSLLNRASTNQYRGFDYEGDHVVHNLLDKRGRFDAYYWIRDNTPTDSLVITPLDSFIFANILPERQFYVKQAQYVYTVNIEDYDKRVRQLDKFYRNDTGPQDYHYISRNIARHFPDRPIYAVVKDSEVSPEVMAGRASELVYEHEGDGANVYRLYPSADPPQQG